VRWYVSQPLHLWLARYIGYDAYLVHWRELERAIQRVLNTPPVMAYDAVRPELKGLIHQFLLKYDVNDTDLPDQAQDELTRALLGIEDAADTLYHRGLRRSLVKMFLDAGAAPGTTLYAVARRAGFTISGDRFSGPGIVASRRTAERAFAEAVAFARGRERAKP
jgi:hypothetical protein